MDQLLNSMALNLLKLKIDRNDLRYACFCRVLFVEEYIAIIGPMLIKANY